MKWTYYNDNDPYAAQWLRNLIEARHIPAGDVDERSIEDVKPEDLEGFTQCHFFAGIAGWSEALRLAGWPEDKPVWTGSCPCQPLSGAGQRKGHTDRRHLWPAFHNLISKSKPPVVFGEQVASKDGREWFAGVRTDLEASGYACGCSNLPAGGVGAPHKRERLYFVADSTSLGWKRGSLVSGCCDATVERHDSSIWRENRENARDRFTGETSLGEWNPQPEPVTQAHGISCAVGQLRAYGNAIVPQVAAEFIKAFLEVERKGEK